MAKTIAQLQAEIYALTLEYKAFKDQVALEKKAAKDKLDAAKAEAKDTIDLLREEIKVIKESKIVKKFKRVFRYAL